MSRFTYCNCPAGFGAGAERHAPDCPGRKLDKIEPTPVQRPSSPMTVSAPLPVIKPLYRPAIKASDFGASKPQIDADGYINFQSELAFDPGYSAQRAAVLELMQKARHDIEQSREKALLDALGMTRDEAVHNRERITCSHYPDKDLYFLDGEPLVEIYRTKFSDNFATVSHRMLR